MLPRLLARQQLAEYLSDILLFLINIWFEFLREPSRGNWTNSDWGNSRLFRAVNILAVQTIYQKARLIPSLLLSMSTCEMRARNGGREGKWEGIRGCLICISHQKSWSTYGSYGCSDLLAALPHRIFHIFQQRKFRNANYVLSCYCENVWLE